MKLRANQKKSKSDEQNWLSVTMPRNRTDLIDCLTTSRFPTWRCQFDNFTGQMGEAIGIGAPDDVYYGRREKTLAEQIELKSRTVLERKQYGGTMTN